MYGSAAPRYTAGMTQVTHAPQEPVTALDRWLLFAVGFLSLAAIGFSAAWWIDNGASVYVARLAVGFILCL